jgi:hypothetical protein
MARVMGLFLTCVTKEEKVGRKRLGRDVCPGLRLQYAPIERQGTASERNSGSFGPMPVVEEHRIGQLVGNPFLGLLNKTVRS